MKTKFFVHPTKMVVCLAMFFTGTVLAITLITIGRFGSAAVFFGIGAIFMWVSPVFGAVISVDETGVTRSVLGKVTKTMRWNEIAEIGIAGTKVLKQADSQKAGELYVYFSPVLLNDQTRFEMMLKWPPKDKLFMLYSTERTEAVRMHWGGKLQLYNTGELTLDNDPPQ